MAENLEVTDSMRPARIQGAWLAVILLVLLGVYLTGLGNPLVFDDHLLTSGGLFSHYGALWPLKPRLFSYGSFVWLQDLFGTGWWKQRLVNLAIHMAVVVALWAFYREILAHIVPDESSGATSQEPYRDSPALILAIAFFALNPVAVYAVAYLIQRSILMATLFTVLSLLAFARGLARHKAGYYLLALVCYALAVASKEHAIMAPLAALPVYVIIARPSGRRLMLIAVLGGMLVAIVGAILALRYGDIIGRPFDQYSRIYLRQLAELGPEVKQDAYPLSIVNQAYLFFKYGLHWLIPYSGWMSIDMRPPFPVSFFSFPQIFGLFGYLAVLVGGVWLVVRYRDWRALLGFSLLLPATLFVTEFATVWVQDPFVLYRTYLWAIGIPGLVFFLVQGLPPRALLIIGLIVAGGLVWQSLDRIQTMSSKERLWTDAIEKMPDGARSVGRWFAYINRAEYYLNQKQYQDAFGDFISSSKLGDHGLGMYNVGALYSMVGQYSRSLNALDAAEKQGYDLFDLNYQRGVDLFQQGREAEAVRQLTISLNKNPPSVMRARIIAARGRMEMKSDQLDAAIADFKTALKLQPDMQGARLSLAMAHIARHDYAAALPILDGLLAQDKKAVVYYGRAVAYYGLRRKTSALADIESAIRLDPNNPTLKEWHDRIQAMP